MGKTLEEAGPKTHVAEIVHHGDKLILPENMSINNAIDLLYRREKYLEQPVDINEKFDVFPFDGAYALSQVLVDMFGWAEGKTVKGMFGAKKPSIYKIPVSPTEKVDVPWGAFSLPGVEGEVSTAAERNAQGRYGFAVSASIKRKDEALIRTLFDRLRAYLRENSLYRGKAIKIRFRDEDGDYLALPEPEFVDVSGVTPEMLILQRDLMASVNANLFTPITRVEDCLANSIKIKRGVLLGGPYGTGKTLAATVAARLAQDCGITYVYSPRADELGDAIAFAKQYQSPACVVFCEDIDRTVTGSRSVKIDDILNILDGIETKSDNIITVLTTNHLDNINQAMLRPGRLDAIINVEPPDAEAAERLVRFYGGQAISETEDLAEVGKTLSGQIPAVIEETVKRAKLFQLAGLDRGAAVTGINSEALRQAAVSMTTQIELLSPKPEAGTPTIDRAVKEVVQQSIKPNLRSAS